MWLLWAAFGCAGGTPDSVCEVSEDLPSCEVADACRGDDTGAPRADCEQTVAWSWACDPDWRATSGGTSETGLIYAGSMDAIERPYTHAPIHTITDAATWADFLAGWPDAPALPAVDFTANIVVIAAYMVNSTCGMTMTRHGVWVPTGGEEYPVEVYVEWNDSTGSCDVVCDMVQRSGVIYAVPRSRGWPEVCSKVVNTCR